MIAENLLLAYDAQKLNLRKKQVLFKIGTLPRYYYQVVSGTVKKNNFNEDGKEFIQGIFSKGNSFGEPPLFGDLPYPASAEALEDSVVWQLKKSDFLKLLKEHPDIHLSVTKTLSKRLHYKATMVAEISTERAEHRLLKLMDYLKTNEGTPADQKYQVLLSRQQMADLTGLRVETVIRAIKNLEKEKNVVLKEHKIYR